MRIRGAEDRRPALTEQLVPPTQRLRVRATDDRLGKEHGKKAGCQGVRIAFKLGHIVPDAQASETGDFPVNPVDLRLTGIGAAVLEGMGDEAQPTALIHGIDQRLGILRILYQFLADIEQQQMVGLRLTVHVVDFLTYQQQRITIPSIHIRHIDIVVGRHDKIQASMSGNGGDFFVRGVAVGVDGM
jgi:hypothetical protein